MTTAAYAARAYTTDSVSTASPARLLIMLFDRLVRDLVAAEQAIGKRDLAEASNQLVHAQAILTELNTSLDVDAWGGARGLSDLYMFMNRELIAANLGKDAAKVRAVHELAESLRQTWREAALAAVSPA